MVENLNQVIILGAIIMINTTARQSVVQLVTDGSGKKAHPRIVFYNKTLTEGFRAGQRVIIIGHVHNYTRRSREGDKMEYIQDIVGDSIDLSCRALHEYFTDEEILEKEGGFPRDKNTLVISGKLTHIYDANDTTKVLTLSSRDEENNRTESCVVTCFLRQAEAAKEFKIGDNVALCGFIQTTYKTIDGKRNRYQSIIARDVAKVAD